VGGARGVLRRAGGAVRGAADALHESADIGDELWARLAREFGPAELLDLVMLAGWYHAISFTANAARVALEQGAPRFADVAP
jgi:hypothetical protein